MEQSKISESLEGNSSGRQQRAATFKCFKCGETGHRQSSCPNLQRRGLLTKHEPVFDTYDDDVVVDNSEEQIIGDSGPMLVLRRNYLLPQSIEESWLRTNIFQSTCTIRGKICRMVIDSGSCTNAISE